MSRLFRITLYAIHLFSAIHGILFCKYIILTYRVNPHFFISKCIGVYRHATPSVPMNTVFQYPCL